MLGLFSFFSCDKYFYCFLIGFCFVFFVLGGELE